MEVYFKMCFVIATGIIGFSYKYYALPKGWPIGTMWLNDFGMPNKHGFFYDCFRIWFIIFSYEVVFCFCSIGSCLFFAFIIMNILKTYTQYLWFLMYLPAMLFLFNPIYKYFFK